MIKKLFALASVSALGGFVVTTAAAGCSSSEVVSQRGENLPADGGKKDARPPPPEADQAAPESCKAKTTYTPDETKAPAAQSGTACTADVITALADGCAEDPAGDGCKSARELAANKTCASCIFGGKDDAEWKVINLMPGATPSARYNQEGCVEHVTGVAGCGKAYLGILDCFNTFCAKCPQGEVPACLQEAADAECLDHRISDQTCANAITSKDEALNACFPTGGDAKAIKTLFVNMAKISCATAPSGGQTDGGG